MEVIYTPNGYVGEYPLLETRFNGQFLRNKRLNRQVRGVTSPFPEESS